MVAALLLAAQASMAGGIGPQGPIGPSGAIGPAGGSEASATPARAPAPPSARVGVDSRHPGNHIEASGNAAGVVKCGRGGTSVNSVDVQGARLHGRTAIVQGRNASAVDTRDCPPPADGPAPSTQINGIRIR